MFWDPCVCKCVCVCVCVCVHMCSIAQLCPTLCDPMDCTPPGSSVHEDFPGKNTGVGSVSSSRGSSWARNGTHVSCIDRQILYHCTPCRDPYSYPKKETEMERTVKDRTGLKEKGWLCSESHWHCIDAESPHASGNFSSTPLCILKAFSFCHPRQDNRENMF